MTIRTERDVAYFGYEHNLRIWNDDVELILPTEYGPRIMRYARLGGPNVFGEISPAEQGDDTQFGDKWHIYGGHRLWHAPEDTVRTYWPDNAPVHFSVEDGMVKLTQRIEEHTHLEKSLEVRLEAVGSRVSVLHRITNRGFFEVELSPWALTVMTTGGRAIFPQADFAPHPLVITPARPLVLWPFTRMNDPRFTWGDRYFFLRQDPERKEPQKVGFYSQQGWMAYSVGPMLFVKFHAPAPGAHTDLGCNVETFTNDAILELETLGPIARIAPGASIVHVEDWFLFDDVELGETEQSVAAALTPLLDAVKQAREHGGV